MGILDWCRHQMLGLVGRIAEHDPLIASAFVFGTQRIDTLRNMRRLFMQKVCHLASGMMELVLLIADVLNAIPRNRLNTLHVLSKFFL